MADKDQKTVRRPDIEAVLRMENREIAVVAFFKDAYGGFDVLVGLEDFDLRNAVAHAFGQCATSVTEAAVVEFPSNAPASDAPF